MREEALIIGGGVSGVTTGIVLRLLGQRTRIVCRHWLGDTDGPTHPHAGEARFASQYPAASIIPHGVHIASEAWHMRMNLRFFEALHFIGAAGVRKQRHYEVYESPVPVAGYAPAMPGYRALPSDGSGEPGAPRRTDDTAIYGWSFQMLFAEMPTYRAFLAQLYRKLGGEAQSGQFFQASDLARERADVIVNCGGAWAASLFGDPAPSRFVKGMLVRVDTAGRIPSNRATSEIFSYNYQPAPAIYARPGSAAADVYCYPRTDGWLFGGTRLESVELRLAPDANPESAWPWEGETWSGPTISLPRHGMPGATLAVPAPIVALNSQILQTLTGHDARTYPLSAMEGYRHQRRTVRLEREEQRGRPVIHNYGHGGAGVTLSWSCAIQAATLAGATEGLGTEGIERLLVESARV